MAAKKLVWRSWTGLAERGGGLGLRRTLSTADHQIPAQTIEVPNISLTVKADKSREPLLPSPPSLPLSTPVSYYLDTHSVVLQLQGTGQIDCHVCICDKVRCHSIATGVRMRICCSMAIKLRHPPNDGRENLNTKMVVVLPKQMVKQMTEIKVLVAVLKNIVAWYLVAHYRLYMYIMEGNISWREISSQVMYVCSREIYSCL